MFQKIEIIGRVTRDAEGRYTPSGKFILSWNMAVDVGYGENKKTMWVRCQLWGERGEKAAQHILKGKPLFVEGRLNVAADGNPPTWTDQGGKVKASFEIDVQNYVFLPSPKREGEEQGEMVPAAPQQQWTPPPADVPF